MTSKVHQYGSYIIIGILAQAPRELCTGSMQRYDGYSVHFWKKKIEEKKKKKY